MLAQPQSRERAGGSHVVGIQGFVVANAPTLKFQDLGALAFVDVSLLKREMH